MIPCRALLDVVVGGSDQCQQDALDILADVPGFSQPGGIRDRQRNVQDPGQRLGKQRLAAAAWARAAGCSTSAARCRARRTAFTLVMVVDGDRKRPLRSLLPDDVLAQDRVYLARLGSIVHAEARPDRSIPIEDLVAELDALVADVNPGAGDQPSRPVAAISRRSCNGGLRRSSWSAAFGPFSRSRRCVARAERDRGFPRGAR